MRQFFITVAGTVFGIFTFLILLIFMMVIIGTFAGMTAGKQKPSEYVLSLDLRSSMRDQSGTQTLFGPPPPSVVSTVRALDAAKNDRAVKGLLIRANSFGMTPASAEELRLAILDFKQSGKFVLAHSMGFEGTSVTSYQAVSASDEIWQQSASSFAVAGLGSETPFYGGVFEKFGAKPEFEQFYEYKTAVNSYTKTGITDAQRESTTSMLSSLYSMAVSEIAEDRVLERAEVERLFEAAPLTAEQAKEAGLIDALGHYLEAEDYIREKAGNKKIKLKSMRDYMPTHSYSGPAIALIEGQGAIVPGRSAEANPLMGMTTNMGSDTMSEAFQDAIDDKSVKAIIFRVSSPGGSAAASDQIHDAVLRAKAAGKPVIVSMGQYAASGGYYVSAPADKIIAMPTTITGSIGVFGGKIAMEGTYAKIGMNVDAVSVGGNYVGVYSANEPFTQAQRAGFHSQMAEIYKDFTGLVASGRGLPIERVQEIAKGRVWTGEQAKELGLVDELGGLQKAIDVTKEVMEVEPDSSVRLKRYPRAKSTTEQLSELLGEVSETRADMARLREIIQMPEVQMLLEARDAQMNQTQMIGQELRAPIPNIK